MSLDYAFGVAIKRRRGNLGISQEELAHRASLHRTYVSLLERGQRTATLDTIIKLAQALRTTGADLLREAEELASQSEKS